MNGCAKLLTIITLVSLGNNASAYGFLGPAWLCWGTKVGQTTKWTTNSIGKPDCEVIDRSGRRVAHAIYYRSPKGCAVIQASKQCKGVGKLFKDSMADYRGQSQYHMTNY